ALKIIRTLRPQSDDLDATLAIGAAHLEAGSFEEAHGHLGSLKDSELDGDAEYLRRWYLAQAAYSLGQPQEALNLLYSLEPADKLEHANLYWWMGICYDHMGKTDRANSCFQKATELDPAGAPRPIPLSAGEVEKVVQEVAAQLPEELRKTFEEVPVIVEDLPPLALVAESKGQLHPDTLGLYVGRNLLEQSVLDTSSLPPAIYIYRRNLERFVRSREEFAQEIRITLLHELGHHLGYDEDDLAGLGLA
ncbi:MAG: metallopeptidase family protein, partial [Planctomycetota bacterium]